MANYYVKVFKNYGETSATIVGSESKGGGGSVIGGITMVAKNTYEASLTEKAKGKFEGIEGVQGTTVDDVRANLVAKAAAGEIIKVD